MTATETAPRINTDIELTAARRSDGRAVELPADDHRQNIGRFKIPGDVIARATANLPDNQRAAIRWLGAYAAEHDLTCGEIGEKLDGYSDSIVGLVFRGKYTSDLSAYVAKIEKLRKSEEPEKVHDEFEVIRTALTDQILNIGLATRRAHRISFITGPSQVGKTTNLLYAAEKIPNTYYFSVPTQGTLIHLTAEMAGVFRIPNQRAPDLRRRIMKCVDARTLLIFDEVHHCIPKSSRSSMAIQTLEFIREIHDRTKCGVLLSATEVLEEAFASSDWSKLLQQLFRRRLLWRPIKPLPSDKDLNDFAAHFKLPPATGAAKELQDKIIKREALGMWLSVLRMGSDLAVARKQKMSWADVISAEAGLRELEGR